MSKDILVYVEQRAGVIQNVGYELCGEARRLASNVEGAKVVALVIGDTSSKQAEELRKSGADIIYYVEDKCLKHYLNETYTKAFEEAVKEVNPNAVLIGASSIGRDLAPRLSARINTGLTADCTKLEMDADGSLYSTRPAFGGNLFATIICPNHRPQMSTVRPGVMKRTDSVPEVVEVRELKVKFDTPKVEVLEDVKQKQEVGKIEDAKHLVAVGRGCGNDESLENAKVLADLLGGSVATARSLVDEGKLPQDKQVGQTGKTVRPDLYLAFGISGAVQHLAGMEDSDYIIAINKDKGASIFNVADLGIVGDGNAILPLVIEEIKNLQK
ncbi:MAG: electron transfer flavoprotein subunit alpha/FixB family protein [Erysipelotrichaceae bacterium]|nr:electron transfer flavoprotein subunit alpha/FixB family protein [Erysipelotrichaceae bacterium]